MRRFGRGSGIIAEWLRHWRDPWRLAQSGRLHDALAAYDSNLRATKTHAAPTHASRATVLMMLGRLDEARADLEKADRLRARLDLKIGISTAYKERIAVVCWLSGSRLEAMRILEGLLALARDSCNALHGDFRVGLLLWYMAVSSSDAEKTHLALEHLAWSLPRSESRDWLARVAEAAIETGSSVAASARWRIAYDAVNRAARALRKRGLCQVRFYDAVYARSIARAADARSLFRQAAQLTEAALEQEWHLANFEANHIAT